MRLFCRGLLSVLVGLSNLTCSVNILENFADKNTNMAYYYDALKMINELDFSGALEKLALISGSFASDRKVIKLKADANAGLCGLRFFPLVLDLANLSTERLFPLLMDHFRTGTTTTKIDYCITAEGLIESIGTTAERTSDENMALVLVAFAKIGSVLSYYADGDQNGTVSPPYDICTIGGARTAGGTMPASDATELAWSVVLAINNITAVSTSVDLGDESLADINAACTALGTLNPAYNFCAVASKAALTANHLKGVRSLVKEDLTVGLDTEGGGCNGDVGTCFCP